MPVRGTCFLGHMPLSVGSAESRLDSDPSSSITTTSLLTTLRFLRLDFPTFYILSRNRADKHPSIQRKGGTERNTPYFAAACVFHDFLLVFFRTKGVVPAAAKQKELNISRVLDTELWLLPRTYLTPSTFCALVCFCPFISSHALKRRIFSGSSHRIGYWREYLGRAVALVRDFRAWHHHIFFCSPIENGSK